MGAGKGTDKTEAFDPIFVSFVILEELVFLTAQMSLLSASEVIILSCNHYCDVIPSTMTSLQDPAGQAHWAAPAQALIEITHSRGN